jgi:hypothetical protein
MPIYLRQSTASQEIPLGYFLDSTDGDTEETGLTIANTDIKIWKTGATTLADKNSGGATHISNGVYYAVLDATDTDTIGPLVIFCHKSGALAIRVECCVLDEAVYDAMFGTTALATTGAAMTLTSGERTSVADALLDRDMSTGTDSGSATVRTVRQALRFLRNKWSLSGTTLTVCKEDDSTTSWTSTVTATSGASPITANDPASS